MNLMSKGGGVGHVEPVFLAICVMRHVQHMQVPGTGKF